MPSEPDSAGTQVLEIFLSVTTCLVLVIFGLEIVLICNAIQISISWIRISMVNQ